MPVAPPGYHPSEITFWWVSIGLAVVVVLVVILLLSFLIRLVKEIDQGVGEVTESLRSISQNTSNTTLIPETATAVDAVLDEGLHHHLFLGRILTGAGTPIGGEDR